MVNDGLSYEKFELMHKLNRELHKIDHYLHIKIDGLLGMLGYFSIDVIDFDERLKQFYPDDYRDNMSMKDFMLEKFGEYFVKQFEQLL